MPQMMKLLVPPTWAELMADPVYRAYVRKPPRLPVNVSHGFPWVVYAQRHSEAAGAPWARKMFPTYADAYYRVRDLLKQTDAHGGHVFADAAIVSRRTLIAPPIGYTWRTNRFSWCGRCRRPTMFMNVTRHHALKDMVALATEDTERCYYCGAREIFASRGFKPRKVPRNVAEHDG